MLAVQVHFVIVQQRIDLLEGLGCEIVFKTLLCFLLSIVSDTAATKSCKLITVFQ